MIRPLDDVDYSSIELRILLHHMGSMEWTEGHSVFYDEWATMRLFVDMDDAARLASRTSASLPALLASATALARPLQGDLLFRAMQQSFP